MRVVAVNSDGGRGRGKLDITYVDEEMRISRGDKGNLFVLLQEDPKARIKRFGW